VGGNGEEDEEEEEEAGKFEADEMFFANSK
jgi:hypothetical protein